MSTKKRAIFNKEKISLTLIAVFLMSFMVFSVSLTNMNKINSNLNSDSNYLIPEIKPQHAEYGDQMDFAQTGVYILAPNYVRLHLQQNEVSGFQVKAIDAFNWNNYWDGFSPFKNYSLYKNGIYQSSITNEFLNAYLNLFDYDEVLGIANLTFSAFHEPSQRMISKVIRIETVPTDTPLVAPYYSDYVVRQYDWKYVNWQVSSPNSYSYTLTFDGSVVQSDTGRNNPQIDYSYSFSGIGPHNVVLTVTDDVSGGVTTNAFTIRCKSNEIPEINRFEENWDQCGNNFWEGKSYNLESHSNQPGVINLLYRNDDYSWYRPFRTIPFNGEYRERIGINQQDVNYDPNINWNQNYQIRAFATEIDGLIYKNNFNDRWRDTYYGAGNGYIPEQLHQLTIPVQPTRTLNGTTVVDNITEWNDNEYYEQTVGQLEYEFFFVIDSTNETTIEFYGLGGQAFRNNFNDQYPRQPTWQNYDFRNEDDDTTSLFEYKEYDGNYHFPAGVVFVVDFANPDAIDLPITIKLTFPDEITPDTALGEPPLRLLEWITDCSVENQKGYWKVMDPGDNKTITATSVELYIHKTGLYAFGADYADYHLNDEMRPPFIPGYPLLGILPAVAICTVLILRNMKTKRV